MTPRMTDIQCRPIEINAGNRLWAVAFSANGDRLVGGGQGIRAWQTETGRRVASMETGTVNCLAVSKDEKWVAAGTNCGVLVLDATTHKQVFAHEDRPSNAVHFSPDSSRLVAASDNRTAVVWDLATRIQAQILHHEDVVIAAKYSPQGDRIATATFDSVRVWDSKRGRSLLDINVTVVPWYNNGLLWLNNHLVVISNGKIKEFDASTGSTLSQWPVPDTAWYSCIALPKHEEFIVYATKCTVTFWDMSTHSQLALIVQHPQDIHSIALSPDDRFLAIGGKRGKTIIKRLFGITEPNVQVDEAVLDSWNLDELENAEALLTTTIAKSRNPSHDVLAGRALVRTRLGKWDEALVDAENALKAQPSALAFIAKGIAHIGNGERHKGYGSCDIAFKHVHPSHITFLLLIKAIIMFIAGECLDAISRMDDLIATVHFNSICYVVQAYMYLLLGNSHMDSNNAGGAIASFENAQERLRPYPSESLLVVSLVFGWKFNDLDITIRQRLCEALYAADRTSDAVECFHRLTTDLGEETNLRKNHFEWADGFRQRASKKLEYLGDTAMGVQRYDEAISHYTAALSLDPHPREDIVSSRTKAFVATGSWKRALDNADQVAIRAFIYRVVCECFETTHRVLDAVECFHQMTSELEGETDSLDKRLEWTLGFRQRLVKKLELLGDTAADAQQYDKAISHYTTALSLDPPSPQGILTKQTKAFVATGQWEQALDNVDEVVTRVTIYRIVCECFESTDRVMDAVECFHRMERELARKMNTDSGLLEWGRDFRQRSSKKLELLGETAVGEKRHDEAISCYTTALSLDPPSPSGIRIKRSKAYLMAESWEQALDDANQAIEVDPSSPWGYEMKHAALHKAGKYDDAIKAFSTMLSKMAESPDPRIQQHGNQYISPSSTQAIIRRIVQKTVRRSPRVLINTISGRLRNRKQQVSAFESLSVFNELVSSMTIRIDYVRIKREVRLYFRYVMLSHRWEDDEPLFQDVIRKAVYELERSPTHDKLKTFCRIVQDAGFTWAWCDTCCIEKSDHFVLQEALIAMFKWYQCSAMVIVFLRGVRSSSQRGSLMGSTWNTRAWTLQEYIAAKVIRFYTEDWTLYLDLELPNHKLALEVISEMEQATGVPAQQLETLCPGLSSIREKSCLASTRETTVVEDTAYSLLGIFSVTGMPAIYGEGESSLGRLLAHILSGSGDVSILAWTGESGDFNSCLPAHITVFNEPVAPHLPRPVPDVEMATTFHSSFDLDAALRLYNCLDKFSPPWFAASRMKLPCIAFRLPSLLHCSRTRSARIFRAETAAFGTVEIRTKQNLSQVEPLYLVHPWLDTLLERGNSNMTKGKATSTSPGPDDEEFSDEESSDEQVEYNLSSPTATEPRSQPTPPMDRETRARRLVAHLRQPFGALLLTLASDGGRAVDYKRVAADSMITVQFQESVSLADILENVRTLDVL